MIPGGVAVAGWRGRITDRAAIHVQDARLTTPGARETLYAFTPDRPRAGAACGRVRPEGDVMAPSIRVGVMAVTLAAAVALPAHAQQGDLTAAQVAAVKAEVTAAVDKYYAYFSAHDMKALPEEIFNIPWIVIGGSGPQPDLTKEQALARFEASLKDLLANGWGKSIFTTENVCVLNGNAALASGYNTRYKTDGSVMSVGGVTYLFGKTKQGWRVVSYTGHARGKVVRCD
jgi:hypothetical protein